MLSSTMLAPGRLDDFIKRLDGFATVWIERFFRKIELNAFCIIRIGLIFLKYWIECFFIRIELNNDFFSIAFDAFL